MKDIAQHVARFIDEWGDFERADEIQREALAELIKEKFGVRLRWLVVKGSLRKGAEEDRFKPPTKIGGYPTVRYGWVNRYRFYEGQVGDPVHNDENQPEGICVRNEISWGSASVLGWQSLAWISTQ